MRRICSCISHSILCRASVVERGKFSLRMRSEVSDIVVSQTAPAHQTFRVPSESTPLLGGHPPPSRLPSPSSVVVAPSLKSVITTPVIVAVLNYSLLALCEICFPAILPVYLASAPLSLTPRAIGIFMGGIGIFNGTFQVLCTATLVERWGAKRIYQISICAFFPLWALLPLAVSIARDGGTGPRQWSLWLLACIGVMLVPVMLMSYSKHPNL